MANIKLGAIITDIAGSVGGSTFRRTPAGIVLYNKQGPQIKSAFAKNSVKNKLGSVISAWATLDEGDKDFYNTQTLLFSFPGKFGNLKHLTGRQFYIKLNTQLIPTSTLVDINSFDKLQPLEVVSSVSINASTEEFIVDWGSVASSYWLLVQVTPLRQGSSSKPHLKAFCTSVKNILGETSVNIWKDFEQQFPFYASNQFWNVNVIFMNVSGFQSSVQSFKVEL